MIPLIINSKKICQDVRKHLKIKRETKNDIIKFPDLKSDELKWAFIRGLFDGNGHVQDPTETNTPSCNITLNSIDVLKSIAEFCKIPYIIDKRKDRISYEGINSIDFLGKIYENSQQNKLMRKYEKYIEWILWRSVIMKKCFNTRLPYCYIYKTDKNAVFPTKAKPSDVGYDLTVIKEQKKWNMLTTLYDTGIKIRVKPGFYAEIVPRSSLSKSGYMLANSIGIIDPSYNGNLFIALIKVDPSAPDITLPFRCCQLIFRKQIFMNTIEVTSDFEDTARGDGGFGSSG